MGSTATIATTRKAKSRANQTAKQSAQEKIDAKKRMAIMRGKKKVQKDCLCLRKFLTQDILDDVDKRVADLEYGIISSKWDSSKWKKIWNDPNFESMINDQEYISRLLVSDLAGLEYTFLSCENQKMKDDIASFKRICPKIYLHKFELKVAQFELSLLTKDRKKAWDLFVKPVEEILYAPVEKTVE